MPSAKGEQHDTGTIFHFVSNDLDRSPKQFSLGTSVLFAFLFSCCYLEVFEMTGYKSKRAAAQDKLDSMEREALKLALEALRMADELCRGHGVDFKEYGLEFDRDIQVKYKDAITAIKEALAHPAQERNFCERCGKRTNDIHTCTPPQENT
jgi:hypothetical protein